MSLAVTPTIARAFMSGGLLSKAIKNLPMSSSIVSGRTRDSFPVRRTASRATSFLCLRMSPSEMICPLAFLAVKSNHAFALNKIMCSGSRTATLSIVVLPLT